MCFHMKSLSRRCVEGPKCDMQALMVGQIQLLTSQSIDNTSTILFGTDDAISSPICMPHYSQNIKSFLTGRCKELNMFFFLNWLCFVSQIRPTNLVSFTTLIGVFPRGVFGFGKNPYCWWKWIHPVFEEENLKPFSDTQSLMLLMHWCIALSTFV